MHVHYGYLTWFLAVLFLINNLGGIFAYLDKDTLMCKNKIYVVKVFDSNVLVTSDYKKFTFLSKESCSFEKVIY